MWDPKQKEFMGPFYIDLERQEAQGPPEGPLEALVAEIAIYIYKQLCEPAG